MNDDILAVARPVVLDGETWCAMWDGQERWVKLFILRTEGNIRWAYHHYTRTETLHPDLRAGLGKALPPVPTPKRYNGVCEVHGIKWSTDGRDAYLWERDGWDKSYAPPFRIARWLLAHEGPDGLPPEPINVVTLEENAE